jgi:hypothetical protein
MRRLLSLVAVAVVTGLPLQGASFSAQKAADIDPNALADALMGVLGGAYISDSTDLLDDSEADALASLEALRVATAQKLADLQNKNTQDEDVIPIAGDSGGPVDEILDDEEGGLHLVSLLAPKRPPSETLQRPFIVFTGFRDGVMQMRVFSPHGLSRAQRDRLPGIHAVLVPLTASGKQRLESWLAEVAPRGSGVHVMSQTVRGYCVEAAKLPPASGDVFLAAPRAAQAQFKPGKVVRLAGDFAAAHGYLRPQGDAATYGRSITQYAIWTKLEHWDEARFTNEFLARTRNDMQQAKKPWSSETEKTLRALAPARWHDAGLVIAAADKVESKMRTPGAEK